MERSLFPDIVALFARANAADRGDTVGEWRTVADVGVSANHPTMSMMKASNAGNMTRIPPSLTLYAFGVLNDDMMRTSVMASEIKATMKFMRKIWKA